ncbi:hypothetical protein BB560_006405 [Smittium megazygosporum]|uniref:Alpha/beta hydrolase fold-3 domain-containing protein n=1 Tax=Smittium megazygosporum TaxID=133381 RepID=A0A2T9Y6K0_9FUNG|nr:hypothetical protein BB560_006416 [Smittium megazygosporum]PVU88064.1 hypothetical protein BB560_006405 [Smittium megazygosporum]
MTDLIRGVFKSKSKTPEQDAILRKNISEAAAESALSYFRDGPRYPSWSLGMQVTLDLVCATFGAMRHTNTLNTNEEFSVAKIGNAMRIIRDIEVDLTDCPGENKTEYWRVDHPSLYESPHPFFDELMSQDKERVEQNNPRQLYSEVVVHNEVIEAAKNKGHSMDQIMSLAPLDENEYIVVHFHGGAYCYESTAVYRRSMLDFSQETGCRVFLPDYRFAPENPFPASLVDCYQFYLHLINMGYKSSNILIMGDSAGGNAVLNILMLLKRANKNQPKGAVAFSPWCDLTENSGIKENEKYDWVQKTNMHNILATIRLYADPGKPYDADLKKKLQHPLISPLYGDFTDCAPIYIQGGGSEVLINGIDALAKHIGATEVQISGGEHPGFQTDERNIYEKYLGMPHVFFHFDDAPEHLAAIKGVGNFFRKLNQK